MLRGWMLYSWAMANDPIHRFNGIRMVNGGYIGLEREKLMEELKKQATKI
jgi:hypothetical protein